MGSCSPISNHHKHKNILKLNDSIYVSPFQFSVPPSDGIKTQMGSTFPIQSQVNKVITINKPILSKLMQRNLLPKRCY